jgi:hypothetical protein
MGAAADIVIYASVNMPADDSATSGGAIDVDQRVEFTQILANDDLEAVSSSGSDTTPQVTVRAQQADGTVVSQTATLTGTTPVVFSTLGVIERVLKVSMNADAVGTVTIRRSPTGTTIGTIPIGERGFMCFHREASAAAGSTVTDYYKVFAKNTHGTDTLNSAQVVSQLEATGRITFALAASKGDSGSVANRLTSPGLTFDSLTKNVPTNALAAGETIGIWIRAQHPAGDSGYKSTWTLRVQGNFP